MNESGENLDRTNWGSRRVRLTLYVTAIILTIAFMTACAVGLVLILDACDRSTLHESAFCSDTSRVPLELLSLAILTAIVLPWVRFLTRTLAIKEEPLAPQNEIGPQEIPPDRPTKDTLLPLGQILRSGEVELMNAGRHRITVHGLALRFWGGYALRRGWIKNGDRAVFVYQKSPAFGLNYVLAFWRGGGSQVRSVGGVIHSCYLALGTMGAIEALSLEESGPWWLMPVCIVLIAESSIYLILLNFAKRALRQFSDHSVC